MLIQSWLPGVILLNSQMFSFSFLSERRISSSYSQRQTQVRIHSLAPGLLLTLLLSVINCQKSLRSPGYYADHHMVHSTDDVILIIPDEQEEVADILDALESHMYSKGRQNPERFRSLAHG